MSLVSKSDEFDAVATKGNSLTSDACSSSTLKLQVYAQRTIRHDKDIGGMEENIERLLSQENNGGHRIFLHFSSQS